MTLPGIADITRTLRLPQLILYMAWSDVRARYKRSVLGPLWITLGTGISVVAFGYIWSELLKMDRAQFVPILTIGLILWQFISACIVESSSVFIRQGAAIRNLDLPLSLYPAQLVLRHLINLAHNLPLLLLVALIMGVGVTAQTLLAVPAFLLVLANLFWMTLLIGMLGARFRDLEYLISMIMPLIMFLSPVFYRPSALSMNGKYIWFNPFSSFIEIIRYPLLGQAIPDFVVWINLGLLVVGGSITLRLFNAKLKRIAFWI